MLKLTRFDDRARDMWIMPKDIVAITDDPLFTTVWTHHHCFLVAETPEQILAMPEMIMFNSATIVPKGFTWDGYNNIPADRKDR